MTRLIFLLFLVLWPWTVKAQEDSTDVGLWIVDIDSWAVMDSVLITPTVRVPIETLTLYNFHGAIERTQRGTITIDSVFIFDRVDTTWVEVE